MANPFEPLVKALTDKMNEHCVGDEFTNRDAEDFFSSEEAQAIMNNIVLGALAGMMNKMGQNARGLLRNACEMNRLIPQDHEVIEINVPVKVEQSVADSIMNGPAAPQTRTFYFTVDFMKHLTEYLRFIHLSSK